MTKQRHKLNIWPKAYRYSVTKAGSEPGVWLESEPTVVGPAAVVCVRHWQK